MECALNKVSQDRLYYFMLTQFENYPAKCVLLQPPWSGI